jgi:hypothetical protein
MKLGDVFTMGVPPRYEVPHLFFVITDPLKNDGVYHIVNITTDQLRAGKECILEVGDHEWITETSFVSFADMREIDLAKSANLQALIGKAVKMRQCLKPTILEKIVAAGKISKAIPMGFKKYL